MQPRFRVQTVGCSGAFRFRHCRRVTSVDACLQKPTTCCCTALHLHPFSCIYFLAGNAQSGYGYAAATTDSDRKQGYWLDIGIAVDVIEICRSLEAATKSNTSPLQRGASSASCIMSCVPMYRRPAPEPEVAKMRRQAVVQPLHSAIAGLLLRPNSGDLIQNRR